MSTATLDRRAAKRRFIIHATHPRSGLKSAGQLSDAAQIHGVARRLALPKPYVVCQKHMTTLTAGFVLFWLVVGVLLGGLFLLAVRQRRPGHQSIVLSITLIVVALVYVAFALANRAGWRWLLLEVVGAGVYTMAAFLSIQRSLGWLVLGWATHPFWDVGVHLVNRQPNFAPAWYEIACVSFDFIVAAYVFLAHRSNPRGLTSKRVTQSNSTRRPGGIDCNGLRSGLNQG